MQLKELFERYISLFPYERIGLKVLESQLESGEDVVSRKNFTGHVTASGFIVNPNTKQVLLLHHSAIQKLLQPGGHIDDTDDTVLEAAYRESQEETGINRSNLKLVSMEEESDLLPVDIDSHYIPANPKKDEPEHRHHDYRYLFTTSEDEVSVDTDESDRFEWVDWDVFKEIDTFKRVAIKIEQLIW